MFLTQRAPWTARSCCAFAVTTLILVTLAQTCSAGMYTITPIGPGQATGINNAGQVVGFEPGGYRAFLYSGGSVTYLPLTGGTDNRAYAINDLGQIVGYSKVPPAPTYAFSYENGVVTNLGNLGGYGTASAYAINEAGQVVGFSPPASGPGHAFSYENGSMTDLGSFGGTSVAYGINNAGQVVGYSDDTMGYSRAFLYENGTMTDLGTLGGVGSTASAINDLGQIVGLSYTGIGSTSHAFLYQAGSMLDLGTLGRNSAALAINELGQVVGSSTTTSFEQHAFLYSGGTMVDLNSLIDQLSGWTISAATGINDSGQIAANAYHELYGNQAVLLTPAVPEPSNIVLFATGLGCILLADRRF